MTLVTPETVTLMNLVKARALSLSLYEGVRALIDPTNRYKERVRFCCFIF